MEDDEQNEFVTEQVQEIMKKSVVNVLQGVAYSKDKVSIWSNQIIDSTLKALAGLNKPFKYVVTCVIMQKNGAPCHSAASCYYDVKTDGHVAYQVCGGKDPENPAGLETLDCIVTVFACVI
jgi:dynein light chain Tctex-type 1